MFESNPKKLRKSFDFPVRNLNFMIKTQENVTTPQPNHIKKKWSSSQQSKICQKNFQDIKEKESINTNQEQHELLINEKLNKNQTEQVCLKNKNLSTDSTSMASIVSKTQQNVLDSYKKHLDHFKKFPSAKQKMLESNQTTEVELKNVNHKKFHNNFKFSPKNRQSNRQPNSIPNIPSSSSSNSNCQSPKITINFKKPFLQKNRSIEKLFTMKKNQTNYNNQDKISQIQHMCSNLAENKIHKFLELNKIKLSQSNVSIVNTDAFIYESASQKKKIKLNQQFEIGPTLGNGKFGEVVFAVHKETGFLTALKKISKIKIKQFGMVDNIAKELKLHNYLDHPKIIKFYGFFETQDSVSMILEFMNKGTLFEYLNQKGTLDAVEAVDYLRDVIQAVNYLHSKSIAHRDIKPENIVLSSEGIAKLCDFGWSTVVKGKRRTFCGTLDYSSPEILEGKPYDLATDIWAIGILTFQLLAGSAPFQNYEQQQKKRKILNVNKQLLIYPNKFPESAKQFINSLLDKNPDKRPKCNQLLSFNFFKEY